MNRLESIKKNMETCTDWYVDNSEFLDDMKWLIQRLERYENALHMFADETNWMGRGKLDYPNGGIAEWDGEVNPIKLAKEALKE